MAGAGIPHQALKIEETGDLLRLMDRIPEVLREKLLKKAIRKAIRIMQKRAQSNAKALPHKWNRWLPPFESVRLDKSIAISTPRTKGTTVKGMVFTTGQARMYAAPVEYGHHMHLPGSEGSQGRVERSQFWRPAIDNTEEQQRRIIIKTLKELASEIQTRTNI